MMTYVLFPNHESGLNMHRKLREQKRKSQIAPTPRSLSRCCGISLIIDEGDVKIVEQLSADFGISIIGIESVACDINPQRNEFC